MKGVLAKKPGVITEASEVKVGGCSTYYHRIVYKYYSSIIYMLYSRSVYNKPGKCKLGPSQREKNFRKLAKNKNIHFHQTTWPEPIFKIQDIFLWYSFHIQIILEHPKLDVNDLPKFIFSFPDYVNFQFSDWWQESITQMLKVPFNTQSNSISNFRLSSISI